MWHLTDTAVTIRLEFLVGGVPIIPDPDSVKVTLRGADGAVLSGPTAFLAPGTYLDYTVSAGDNTPAVAGTLETRFVHGFFTYQGFPHTVRFNYRLSPFIPMTCTEDTVRGLLGMTQDELEDSDIDLFQGYYTLLVKVPGLPNQLVSGDATALAANDAIAVQAALLKAESIASRFSSSQEEADSKFARLSKFDPYRLVQELSGKLEALVSDLAGTTSYAAAPTLFVVAARTTDPITGA